METAEKRYSLSSTSELGSRRKGSQQRDLFRFLLPELDPGSMVLEIGAGRGEFARETRDRGLEYVGIEPSQNLCAPLREDGFNVISEPVPPIPADDESFDLVHSYDFVEHLLDYREVMSIFAESYRVLRPGGFISVVAPNYETIGQLYYKYEYQHSFVVTRNRLERMLGDCGFAIAASRCYLISLSPRFRPLDRVIAHGALPLLTNSLAQALVRVALSEELLFRANKHLFDHVAVLARKP